MRHKVVWTETSVKQLEKIEKGMASRIVEKISKISENPAYYLIRLKSHNLYKIRVGEYRVIVGLDSRRPSLITLEIGYRSTVYRRY